MTPPAVVDRIANEFWQTVKRTRFISYENCKKKKISVRDRRINHTYFQLRFGLPSDHQYVLLNDPLGSCQITRKRIIKYKG